MLKTSSINQINEETKEEQIKEETKEEMNEEIINEKTKEEHHEDALEQKRIYMRQYKARMKANK